MKYMRYLKDGYVIPFNALLVGNPLFEEFTMTGEPNLPIFLEDKKVEVLPVSIKKQYNK